MKEQIKERIEALRAEMRKGGVAAVIIPQTDPHQSEYIASHWQVRRFLSGFTGSAGSLVVTLGDALVWADSRYFLQAADQLEGTGIRLMKDGLPETPSIPQFLVSTLVKGSTVGIDGMLFSATETARLRDIFSRHDIKHDTSFDVVDNIWTDRPALPTGEVFVHGVEYAGKTAVEKITEVLADTHSQGAESALISALDEIAWTLNIRARDVKCNPVATSYLYLSPEGSTLFIMEEKVPAPVREYLSEAGVKTAPYSSVLDFLTSLPETARVLIEPGRTAGRIESVLGTRAVCGASPVAVPKAVKNDVQIRCIRKAMEYDGVALVKAFMEIESTVRGGGFLDEIGVADILTKYRSQQPDYFDASFDTIAGYGPHGAIVHYSATPETSAKIEPHGLLLVDSGAQYLTGTTDITRTVAMGTPTDEEKHDFTLVLKGHICLDRAIFPEGTRGAQLDILAHQFLWNEGLNYLHGTGHGVGQFLNVHEGPHGIRMNDIPATIRLGMLTSNEPGLYKAGVHGIRCENLVLTVPAFETEFGRFYRFETMTLFPFDTTLLETSIMTEEEITWLNGYHAEVFRRLSPMLDEKETEWLRNKTLPVSK